jgi:chromosome segregation ATPase
MKPALLSMGALFGKKGDSASSRKKSAKYNHTLGKLSQMEHQLRIKMKNERDALNVLDSMLKSREESLRANEEKVVALKKEYDAKMPELKAKEERLKNKEQELKKLEKVNADLLLLKKTLERECDNLEKERDIAAHHAKDEQLVLGQLHKDEAHLRSEISSAKKALEDMHRQFESAYSHATKLTDMLHVKEHELKEIDEKLRHAHAKHSEVSSLITHHSKKEVEACLRRAHDFVERGMIVKARQEYEKIRNFYANLTSKEKGKVYNKIEKLKERLSYHF